MHFVFQVESFERLTNAAVKLLSSALFAAKCSYVAMLYAIGERCSFVAAVTCTLIQT